MKDKMNLENRCPLMGASKAIGTIDDAVMLIIGTEECTYYTKSTQEMKGNLNKCFSVVLDNHDVTFGSYEKVEKAVEELIDEINPKYLFLVTTCVVEIIGDDFNSIKEYVEKTFKIPTEIIQTSHFKGKNEDYGFELVEKSAEKLGIKLKINKGPMMIKRMLKKIKMEMRK